MQSITRQPKLLVKMSGSPGSMTLGFGSAQFEVEPLFKSIKEPPKMGMAQAAEWHMVSASNDGDEVNAWDLKVTIYSLALCAAKEIARNIRSHLG